MALTPVVLVSAGYLYRRDGPGTWSNIWTGELNEYDEHRRPDNLSSDHSSPAHLYWGSDSAGADILTKDGWYSLNSGTTVSGPINRDDTDFRNFVARAADDGTLYALGSVTGIAVSQSTDNGATWTTLATLRSGSFSAGTDGFFGNGYGWWFESGSYSGGHSYVLRRMNLSDLSIDEWWVDDIDPDLPSTAFVLFGSFVAPSTLIINPFNFSTWIIVVDNSNPGAVTFTRQSVPADADNDVARLSIPLSDDKLLVLVSHLGGALSSDGIHGWVSEDQGASWTATTLYSSEDGYAGTLGYNLAYDFDNPLELWTAGNQEDKVYHSSDGGYTWEAEVIPALTGSGFLGLNEMTMTLAAVAGGARRPFVWAAVIS